MPLSDPKGDRASALIQSIDRAMQDRPVKVTVQTHEGFLEFIRRANAGQFRICAMNAGAPGGKFKYELELAWPRNSQQELL